MSYFISYKLHVEYLNKQKKKMFLFDEIVLFLLGFAYLITSQGWVVF